MSASWRQIERDVARLVAGERTWQTMIDVKTPPPPEAKWAIEVKYRIGITVAQIEAWLVHNQVKADMEGLLNALVVKRKAGRGQRTPYLLVIRLADDSFFSPQLASDAYTLEGEA